MRLLALALASLLAPACAVVQKVDTAIDCSGICDRYASCFDARYDTSACASRCRASAAKDPAFRRKADVCNACITERSCVEATLACVRDCVSVVP